LKSFALGVPLRCGNDHFVPLRGAWYWFLPPSGSFRIAARSDIYGMLGFVFFGCLLTLLGESFHRAIGRKAAAEQQAHLARKLFETFMENSPVLSYLKDAPFVAGAWA
jgi:hypothetical protein